MTFKDQRLSDEAGQDLDALTEMNGRAHHRAQDPHRSHPLSQRITRTLSMILIGGVAFHIWSYTFLNDDAYISFRYAAHWADYGEVSYNLGERVEGYTNFLWVALLAFAHRLGADIPIVSLWLSGVLSLFTVWLAGHVSATQMSVGERPNSRQRLFTMMLLALSPSLACWSSGGLEVSLFTLLFTAGVVLSAEAWSQGSLKLGVGAGALYGLTAMTRPEGVLLFGTAGLYRLFSLIVKRQRWGTTEWGGVFGFMVIYLPYFVWRYTYYGYLFPNTYYAKTGADGFWSPGLDYVLSWWIAQPWVIFMLAMWWVLRPVRSPHAELHHAVDEQTTHVVHRDLWWVTALSSLGLILHVARVGGDFMAMHRFLVPLLPLCAVSVTYAVWTIYQYHLPERIAGAPRSSHRVTITLIITLALLSVNAWYQHQNANRVGSHGGVDSIGWLRQFSTQCAQAGRLIAKYTDKQVKLATTAAGALPYYAQRHTIDLLGLNDAWIAHHVPARGHRPGHTKSAPFRYPLEHKVDYLIYHPTFARTRPQAHPRFAKALAPWGYEWRTYRVPGLTPPWWGVWVRKTTPHLTSP